MEGLMKSELRLRKTNQAEVLRRTQRKQLHVDLIQNISPPLDLPTVKKRSKLALVSTELSRRCLSHP